MTIDAPPAPEAIELALTSIVNPARQGLIVNAALTLPDGTISRFGAFSPFPVDQPSVYLLSLDEGARQALTRGGRVMLSLELSPADASEALSPALDLRFRGTFRT